MEIINQYHQVAAASIARVFLGLLFFFQGYDAIFKIGLKNVSLVYQKNFNDKNIPRGLTVFLAWFASYSELICGLCLIAGLFQYIALYLLGLNLLAAAIGFGILDPLWDTRNVFPRLILLILVLIIPNELHQWTLDNLLFNS